MSPRTVLFNCAILLAGTAVWSFAQQIENTPDTWIYSVEGRAQYQDNRDATENDKEDLFSLWFTPGIRLTVDDGLTKAYLSYRPSLGWRDNPRDDQNDSDLYHALEASIRHQASTRLLVGALNQFEMTDDPRVTEGGVIVREDAGYWYNQAKGWLTYGLSDRSQVGFETSYRMKRYDDSVFADTGDEDRLFVSGDYKRWLAPDLNVFVFVGYDQPDFQGALRGDYRGYLGGVGVSRLFSDRWTGTLSLGYEALDYTGSWERDTSMPYAMLATEIKPLARLIVNANAEYSLEPSDLSLYASKEYLKLLLKGTVILSEGLSAYGQVVYANGAYDAVTAIDGEPLPPAQAVGDGDDTLMDCQLGLTVRPRAGRYSGRLAYEYEDWDSDVRESFTRNSVTVAVSMDF